MLCVWQKGNATAFSATEVANALWRNREGKDNMSDMSRVLTRRPGLVTFAGIMMFLLGGFELTWAIVQFTNAAWISTSVYGTFGGYLWLWAILDLVFALGLFYGGYDVLRGGAFGQAFGVVIASISAIRWFFYLPAAPWLAVVVIAIDVLVIYGLVAHSEYFERSAS